MYTILVTSDDRLVTTEKETIMHRSSLVRKLRFLVDPTFMYGNETLNLADFACILEFRLPISNKYIPVILTPSEELYKEKLEYVLSIDTKLTSEVGDVQLKLMWTKPELLADGNFNDHVKLTTSTTITILPVEQWSDYIASSDLNSIAQMILTNQAQAEQLKLYADYLAMTKADSIKYDAETNELSLLGNGQKLDSVTLEDGECDCEEGVPAVDFSVIEPEHDGELDNVIEF
jgi:hypothetical protein